MATELGNHLNLSGFLLHACLPFTAPSALRSVCVCRVCGRPVWLGSVCFASLASAFFTPPVVCMWVLFFCPGDRRRVCLELKGTHLRPRGVEAESFIHTGQHISVSVWCFSATSFGPCLLEQHTHLGAAVWRSGLSSLDCHLMPRDARTPEPRGEQSGPRKC